jgi:hypothetical protein
MTEYITKEQAREIALKTASIFRKFGDEEQTIEIYESDFHKAINLAFSEKLPELEKQFLEQRLEVVGYGVLASNTMKVSSFLLADHPEAEERFDYKPEHVLPLYALKGDSK